MPSVASNIVLAVSALLAAVAAHPVSSSAGHDHSHVQLGGLPGGWYHDEGHHAERLFRRQDVPIASLPRTGTPEWTAKYPPKLQPGEPMDLSTLPAEWIAAYEAAVKDGLIPTNIPPTTIFVDQNYDSVPKYPEGFAFKETDPEVCSTYRQCYNATDLHEAPPGIVGISFDDGPTQFGSPPLYEWLGRNHIQATHFMIGANIRDLPDLFTQAFRMNADLAVHTWTHPHMTSQSDHAVLAELGWTMQIIHDSTGGRLPKYWRPPFGEMDMRVRAIAEHVFGLTAVLWNIDSNDWALPEAQTAAHLAEQMEQWLSGDKSKGYVLLSHELSTDTVDVFINTTWAGIQKYGWRGLSTAQIFAKDGANYQNAKDNLGAVVPVEAIYASPAGTGTGTIPAWVSQPAVTSTITVPTAPVPAPAPPTDTNAPVPPTAPAPAPPADTNAPAPVPSTPAPAPPANPTAPTTPPTTPTTATVGPGAGGQQAPTAVPAPPVTTPKPSTPTSTPPGTHAPTSSPAPDAAGSVRPHLAVTAAAAAAALALALFA